MIRAWTGVALLAVSWLFGLGCYQPASWTRWTLTVALAVVLLGGLLKRLPGRREMGTALALLVPTAWFLPWPYRAAPLLVAAGLALELLPLPRRWPQWLARGAISAGVVLLVQSIALWAYTVHTARSHDLPWPLPSMIGGIAWLLGSDVAVDGTSLVLHVRNQVHRLGATWELLLDPATLGFFFGGATMLALAAWSGAEPQRRWSGWLRGLRMLTVVVAAWLPLRVAVLLAFYLHRSLRTEIMPPTVMNLFLSPWVLMLMLVGPVLLAMRLVGRPVAREADTFEEEAAGPAAARGGAQLAAAVGLVCLGVGIATVVFERDPVGSPKQGRIMFVERHSVWEPTTNPYDTTRYGELASYNYAAIYDYCSRYFEVSQLLESDPIDEEKLSQCDVLVVKTPTARYTREEVEAIGRFVEDGGGLLLIGDHTNVFRCSTYLNDISRQFGFTYRNDLLFHVGSPYDQVYRRPLVPHPVVQHLPPMDFAVSCSIDPGSSLGQTVVRNPGLWSLPSQYERPNYHPDAAYRPDMRYGAFIQVWATRHGSGRVLAFADSTIFSNFCIFQPGKAEMMLGMLQWLNYSSVLDNRWTWLLVAVPMVLLAVGFLAAGLVLAWPREDAWIALLAAGLLGWTLGSLVVVATQRWDMPPPEPLRPMTRVIIDRTTSEAPLATGAFNESETGYGLLEQWIPRLGCFTARRSGPAAFSGDALVVICPTRSVSKQFRDGLIDYVAAGGKLLVLDSPVSRGSTANSLLWPFGLGVNHANTGKPGNLMIAGAWPAIPLDAACEVTGGEPFARLGTLPVGARTRYEKGEVMAIGFGYLFNDMHMGSTWMEGPTPEVRAKYDVLYALVRALLTGEPITGPKPGQAEPEAPAAPATPGLPEPPTPRKPIRRPRPL